MADGSQRGSFWSNEQPGNHIYVKCVFLGDMWYVNAIISNELFSNHMIIISKGWQNIYAQSVHFT